MSRDRFTPVDEGKPVCTADGVALGHVVKVERGIAYVCPREGLVDRYGSLLSTCWRRGRSFHLVDERVRRIDDQEVTVDIRVGDLKPNAASAP